MLGGSRFSTSRTHNKRHDGIGVSKRCDDWEQASHGGELAAVVVAGLLAEQDVTRLGHLLAGTSAGRSSDDDVTAFDSTGLAIQDLAIAIAALERAADLDLPTLEL